MLSLVLGLLRGRELGLDPLAALLLEAQPLPGRLALGIERDNPAEMHDGLFLQSVLVAPEREPPLVIRLVGRTGPALEVRFQESPAAPGLRGPGG